MINLPREDSAFFNAPYPNCQKSIQGEISENSPERPIFGLIPPQFVISVEGRGSNDYSGVTQRQSHVREEVGLLEFQRGEIVGKGIVGGILEICPGHKAVSLTSLENIYLV